MSNVQAEQNERLEQRQVCSRRFREVAEGGACEERFGRKALKNLQFELRRNLARQYHRNERGDQFRGGILIQHDYSGADPNGLSWWDDVQFILGGVRVAVRWQHPRCAYQDMIEDAAMKAVNHLYEEIDGDLFGVAVKSYKKFGRSRKAVESCRTIRSPGKQAWLDALRAEEVRLSKEAEFSVTPSFKVKTLSWCRSVKIVAPIEVRSIADLRMLADLVRRLLKGETSLEREFPGYVYGKKQWVGEGMAEGPLRVFAHRIAGA